MSSHYAIGALRLAELKTLHARLQANGVDSAEARLLEAIVREVEQIPIEDAVAEITDKAQGDGHFKR